MPNVIKNICRQWQGRRIFVMGHSPADFDTLASAALAAAVLCRGGVCAEPVFPDIRPPDDDVPLAVMRRHGIDPAEWVRASNIDGSSVPILLVDCHTSCIAGDVCAVIDHHPTAEPPPVPAELYANVAASSCTLMIYRMARECGIEPTDAEERLAVRSVYMDTQSLLSPKFDPADRQWLGEMIKKHSLDEAELRRQGICLADTSRPISELAVGGLKYYTLAGVGCASSHLQAEAISDELIAECVSFLEARRLREGVAVWVFYAAEPLCGRSVVVYITANGTVRREYDRFLSRAKDIIPDLELRLSKCTFVNDVRPKKQEKSNEFSQTLLQS